MKKTLFILTIALLVGSTCKADTISYWHVYYNMTKIQQFDASMDAQTIALRIADIKSGDSITVRYFRDTPCSDCQTTLIVEDGKRHPIIKGQGKGTFNPVSFSLSDLLQFQRRKNEYHFQVYYSENSSKHKTLLFRIQLEYP